MNEQSIPAVGGELPGQPEAPRRLMDQVQTTDIALRTWREESIRRRAAYDVRQLQLAARNRAWWRRTLRRTALAFGAGGMMGLALAYVGISATPPPRPIQPAPVVEVHPPFPEVIAAPVARPIVVEESIAPLMGAAPLAIVAGSASTWKDEGYSWVQFQVEEIEHVQIAWRDAAGVSVLEPMNCGSAGDGVRNCLAGRSHDRIAHAIEQGATPGTWTVEACGTEGCVPVTTFAAP
jgi:hypothetical protein